jgi:nucleoside-diphosphate-sugar epimerase
MQNGPDLWRVFTFFLPPPTVWAMILLGCGYVGTALARAALARGESVSALTRSEGRVAELRGLGLPEVVVGDIASERWHGALNPAGESIVNCVAPSARGVEGYRHSFIEGTKSLIHWLEQSAATGREPARELVFTSSTGVYPQTDGEWVVEDAPVNAAELSPAGAILREAENLLLALPPRLVRRVWVLRLAGLYGPGRHHLLDALRAGEKTFPGGGEHWVNLLHREDAMLAIRACLNATLTFTGGVYNVADNEPVRKRELVAWLAERLGLDASGIRFDASVSARSSHRSTAAGNVPNRRIANARLRKILGWNALSPSYRDGYENIIRQS